MAPSMMKSGVVKPSAVISASGTRGTATNHSISPAVCTAPRQSCPAIPFGR